MFYFAYGSNLSIDQMKTRAPDSKPLEVGCLKGYRLDFTRHSSGWNGGVADVVLDPNHEVWGLIYEISADDLYCLDDYEGYPDVYFRFPVSIKTLTRSISDIWVYAVVCKKVFTPPTKTYMEIIKNAAVKFGFSEKYCSYIETIETQ
jgi:gamma-glutamylcyclotransferase (GGCT)/AIG2-like uncharacterized protein YtfP